MSGPPALRVSRGFEGAVKKAAANQIKRKAERLAREVSEEADRIMQKELVTDRPAKRRRSPGTRHAVGSVVVDVEQDRDGSRIRLTAHSQAPKLKMLILEHGSRPHVISARNAPQLVFPSTAGTGRATEVGRGGSIVRLEPQYGKAGSRARKQGYGGGKMVRTPRVNHPGTRPYHIMQRALERVVRRSLRG